MSSQQEPGDPSIFRQAADDFTIPAGENWIIQEIRIPGYFNEPDILLPLMVSLSYFHHNPEQNQPDMDPFFTELLSCGLDLDGSLILLPPPQHFAGGHYWLAVQVHMPFTQAVWFWRKQKQPTIFEEYHYRRNDLLWTKASMIISDMIQLDYNLSFSLMGEVLEVVEIVCPGNYLVCEDTPPFPLEGALPPGGMYEGPGVIAGMFYPAETGPGLFGITYTYQNPFGDISVCTFQVEVGQAPTAFAGTDKTILAGENISLSDAFATHFAGIEWTTSGDGMFDNATIINPTYFPGLTDVANGMLTLCITAHALRPCNNPVQDCMLLTIEQGDYPIIYCPSDILTNNDPGLCSATGIALGEPVIEDPFGITALFNDAPPLFPVGETIIVWTVINSFRVQKTCEQTVTVIDNEPPWFTEAPSIIAPNDPGMCGASVHWHPPAFTDNCAMPDLQSNFHPGDFFPVGTTEVMYIATDQNGNQGFSGFTITVIDVEPPEMHPGHPPPEDMTIPNDPGHCGGTAHWEPPGFIDNCGEPDTRSNHQPGDFFPVGETEITYTATDVHGNQTTSGFRITVIDVEPPEMEPPEDIHTGNDPGECGATVQWEPPPAGDNCGPGTITATHQPGDFFPVGETEVTYTATDVHGNQTTSGFRITVIDVEPPEMHPGHPPPEDMTIPNDPGHCGGTAHWEPPGFIDNCGEPGTHSSHQPGDFFPVGETEITYTATDMHGNQSFSGFTITVIDVEPPEKHPGHPPPEDMTIPNDPGHCGGTAHWEPPGFTDNCGEPDTRSNYQPGDFFPVGTTEVTYTATDVHGNQRFSGFTITVIDVEPPEMHPGHPPPEDIPAPNDPGLCGAHVHWNPPGFIDNCGGVVIVSNYQPGDFFPIGATQICHTVTDASGNESVWCFQLEVYDATAPGIKCPENHTVNYDSTSPSEPILLTGATPEGGIYLGNGVENGYFHMDVAGIGIHDITYVYNNPGSGCAYSCSFNIEVVDATSIIIQKVIPYTIYPNPSRGHLTIDGQTEKPIKICISEMTGKHISSTTLKLPAEFNLMGIPKGVYIIRLIDGDSLHYQKIIIQ